MTSRLEADAQGAQQPLRVDGIDLHRLAAERRVLSGISRRFWASNPRDINSDKREILEVSLGIARVINHISFDVGRFPMILRVEYLDANGDWQAVTHTKTVKIRRKRKQYIRRPRRVPVRMTITESIPRRVDSARRAGHPQHFGEGHWVHEAWKINPVKTRKVRFVLTRNSKGKPPRNPNGKKVPYSVALRHVQIGLRVKSPTDIPVRPNPKTPWWASAKDILGSQTVYSTYEQDASRAVDGDEKTFWKSEPQPFPFAVENLYLDLRDVNDQAPVIDRFWIDPVTVGVLCNLYYSNSEPSLVGHDGSHEPIPPQHRTEVGNPGLTLDASDADRLYGLRLGPDAQAGVAVSGVHSRIAYSQPWWVGLDAKMLAAPAVGVQRPLLSMGDISLVINDQALYLISPDGRGPQIFLDPALHQGNSDFRIVAAYFPTTSVRPAYLRLSYRLGSFDTDTVEVAVSDLVDSDLPVKIGLPTDDASTATPAMQVHGLVVKAESCDEEIEDWFLDEGALFVAEPEYSEDDRGTGINARIRMHPMFHSPTNIFGVVGGTGDTFDLMEWTPVNRDYTLKRGYMHLPPTKAKYWKFEMTGLTPEVYGSFVTIDRDVLVFPPDVIAAHQRSVGIQNNNLPDYGIATTSNLADDMAFADSLAETRPTINAAPDATSVLVVKDPLRAAEIAEKGWIWTYQPWHTGSTAPQFTHIGRHRYESLSVQHKTKVAFFAGIREIRPYRTDYSFDDDTPEYVEHFLDNQAISLSEGLEHFDGGVRATGNHAVIESGVLHAYQRIRGVQFATQETDAIQVFVDPNFEGEAPTWQPYGDATVDRIGPSDLLISRGWFAYTYGDTEQRFASYGEMDALLYANVEGNTQPNGSAEGGVVTETYTPSGAGKVMVQAKISAAEGISAPISVEIVNSYDDQVVASGLKKVRAGETETISASYVPGSVLETRTWGDIETMVSDPTTYEELDGYRFYELETVEGVETSLYARVRQIGPSTDAFHVHRIALFDSPIAWYWSNDNGMSWWQAVDVNGDPHGVLMFPEHEPEELEQYEVGRALRWKAVLYRENATISALHVRPWYGTRFRTAEPIHGLEGLGPNRTHPDIFPPTHKHAMWQPRFNPIETPYVPPIVIPPFWRNLVTDPSAEVAVSPPTVHEVALGTPEPLGRPLPGGTNMPADPAQTVGGGSWTDDSDASYLVTRRIRPADNSFIGSDYVRATLTRPDGPTVTSIDWTVRLAGSLQGVGSLVNCVVEFFDPDMNETYFWVDIEGIPDDEVFRDYSGTFTAEDLETNFSVDMETLTDLLRDGLLRIGLSSFGAPQAGDAGQHWEMQTRVSEVDVAIHPTQSVNSAAVSPWSAEGGTIDTGVIPEEVL